MARTCPPEKIQWTVLPSGIRLVTFEMPWLQTVAAGLFVGVGARYETQQEEGTSHFLEHLLFKGSANYAGSEITRLIEGAGGVVNAYTSEEHTCFYFKTFVSDFAQAMEVLIDLVTQPKMEEIDIEKEREVILEEIRSYEDQPSAAIGDIYAQTMWPSHPLGNWVIGTEETVSSFQAAHLKTFHARHYTSENIVISIAGGITHQAMVEALQQQQHRFVQGKLNRYRPADASLVQRRLKIVQKETEQCHFQLGVPCADRASSERWPLRLFNTLAGENMSSRLFQEIREKRGYAYHILSGLDLYEDVGCFYVQGGLEADKVELCLQETVAVLKSFAQERVSEEELARAKRFITGQAVQEMESALSAMLWMGDKLLGKERDFSSAEFCEKIEAVTAEELQQVARKILLSQKMTLVILGPYQHSIESLEKIVQL